MVQVVALARPELLLGDQRDCVDFVKEIELKIGVSAQLRNMNTTMEHPEVGVKATEFFIETADGGVSLHQLAARHKNLILTTQDSYRYHPN
jgi:hypothetical protein